jgi:hypothetical protein
MEMSLEEEAMSSICINCAAPLEVGTKFCGACGKAVEPRMTPAQTVVQPHRGITTEARRYPALRLIALILKIVTVLTALGGVITGFSAATITNSLPNYAGIASSGIVAAGSAIGWMIFLVALCYALFLWASAEMIRVLIDIEESTRLGSSEGLDMPHAASAAA